MSPSVLRVAMAQLNPRVGDVEGNLLLVEAAMDRARAEGASLVVFSEVVLLGYPPRDIVHRRGILKRQWDALDRIAAKTDDGLAAVLGFIDVNPSSLGHSLINGAAFCRGGKVHRRVIKRLLPTYDVFDERRYFAPTESDSVVEWKGFRLGLSVCEDAWARVDHWEMPHYAHDPIEACIDAGAQVLINLSASPFSLQKGEFRRALLSEHATRQSTPLIFVNQVGGNDELVFDGRSLAIDADGEVIARLAEFDEDFQILEIDSDGGLHADETAPIRPVAQDFAEAVHGAIVLGLRDYVRKSGFQKVLLGLSGGIDSSVTAALAAEALGPENVYGIAMPSRFSSSHSREDARKLAENLGLRFDEIPIEGPYQAFLDALSPHFEGRPFDVTEENLQARSRGVYLMSLSNKLGGLVLSCGNKSELAVGYTTLYGDLCGALSPIGDVPKMLVYGLARHINAVAGREVIPARVLEKAPSAELRPDQQDQDSLPPYDVLDEVVDRYVVRHQRIEEIVAAGFDEAMVRRMVHLLHRNEHKRWQAPPIIKVTTKAFGVGWRYPLAASYH
jgi:NAD+ synthase (glutamine-hydrolysing)